jgi:taurine dioxygenase
MTASLHVEPLAGSCGAMVRGADLRSDQSAEHIEVLKNLLDRYRVIALPEQWLDLDRLEQFTEEFGGRDTTPFVTGVEGRPFVIRVIKEPDDELNFANAWHSDVSYLRQPHAYTVLAAQEVPPYGGDTVWANQVLAFATLPTSVQQRVATMTAVHSAGMAYGTGGYLEQTADRSSMTIAPSPDAYATQAHPAVIAHPRTGEPALFVNPVYTTQLLDDRGEPDASLLARLVAHSTHPNLTCRLRWTAGMVAIWDNRSTQHLAINDYSGMRREMFRTSVRGDVPVRWTAPSER